MKNFYRALTVTIITLLIGLAAFNTPKAKAAGISVINEGEKSLKIGGRLQVQYHRASPEGKASKDTVFFRRFRPYIQGSVHKNWTGKFQWDMGKSEDTNEIAVKDAYLQYKGFPNLKLTIGNSKTPFSREYQTSSKKQQFVERTFVGDHNYGTPDRMLGVKLDGQARNKKIEYALAFGSESIDPDNNKLDFDTPVNKNSDFNEGWVTAARIDFHPLGYLEKSQGDFKRETKATIGFGAFTWKNNGNNNTKKSSTSTVDTSGLGCPTACPITEITISAPNTASVDQATGLEMSAALRVMGLSVDAQYNTIRADAVDPTLSSGLYKNGSTTLKNYALEAGYMLVPSQLEVLAGYQAQDADAYAEKWTRTSVGLNWYIKKHDIKLQSTYRMGQNLKGQKNNDEDELFVQMQYVF